jgi:hypothetical protein
MGRDVANVVARFAEGEDLGRLQWEAPRLTFRGALRRVFEGQALFGLRAEQGDLVLADGSRFALGEPQDARWADAIANPPGLLDKLGIKAGMRVGVLAVEDDDFDTALAARAPAVAVLESLDILVWGADSLAELEAIPDLVSRLAPKGALWVVSRKGKAATLKDVEVIAAARVRGLVDNKVCAFFTTHTALRFVRRRNPGD